jgi:hypothetical protein
MMVSSKFGRNDPDISRRLARGKMKFITRTWPALKQQTRFFIGYQYPDLLATRA